MGGILSSSIDGVTPGVLALNGVSSSVQDLSKDTISNWSGIALGTLASPVDSGGGIGRFIQQQHTSSG
jgi:hypothetical protein